MRPSVLLLWLIAALAVLSLAHLFALLASSLYFAIIMALLCVAMFDALALRTLPTPMISRDLPPIVPVAIEQTVRLRLRHSSAARLCVQVHDLHPTPWLTQQLPQRLELAGNRDTIISYQSKPIQRGRFQFSGCALRIRSPFALWWQQRVVPLTQDVRVYPNFAPLAKLALIGADRASRVMGVHLKRRRGEGTEFAQLREYRLGDSLKQIDWKASRRTQKLISREYQDEKNQQVLLLLDTGRQMLTRDGELSHFDHVLNASLMLAHVALRQGDAVGLLASGGESRFMAPARGMGSMDTLLNTIFDLQPSPVATDYLAAAATLASKQTRRALVLLITNVRDEAFADLSLCVNQLRRRHLVCVLALREDILQAGFQAPIQNLDDAVRVGALAQYVEQRSRITAALRASGTPLLDVSCGELPAALVQHYLAIKRAGQL
jgi:uncharacterized protein (DUF58 family)